MAMIVDLSNADSYRSEPRCTNYRLLYNTAQSRAVNARLPVGAASKSRISSSCEISSPTSRAATSDRAEVGRFDDLLFEVHCPQLS